MKKVETLENLYFIGIGGSGMAPLAEFARLSGYEISGSDLGNSPSILNFRKNGVSISNEQRRQNLNSFKGDCIYSTAIKDSNPEKNQAKDSPNINLFHRSDLLNRFVNTYKSIAIAGTHGKTTMTFLTQCILSNHTKSVNFIAGAPYLDGRFGCRKSDSEYFVFEADESDGTFQKYSPFAAIITNVDEDHLDYYDSLSEIEAHFISFAKKISKEGLLVVHHDYESLFKKEKICCRIITYGDNPKADYNLLQMRATKSGTELLFETPDKEQITLISPLLGYHNSLNTLAAIALTYEITQQRINPNCLKDWFPINRRLNHYILNDNLHIIDDYAHNPPKIDACIQVTLKHFSNFRKIVLFEPHRYTRFKALWSDFTKIFSNSAIDELWVTDVYAAGETEDKQYNSKTFTDHMRNFHSVEAKYVEKNSLFLDTSNTPTVLIIVGAGKVYEYTSHFLNKAKE